MKDYIQLGLDNGYISFNEDRSRIIYISQNKERNYNNPEGQGCLYVCIQSHHRITTLVKILRKERTGGGRYEIFSIGG